MTHSPTSNDRPLSRRAAYKQLENRREEMMRRLSGFDERIHKVPAYRTAMTLLTKRFTAATLPARAEVLEAAEFTLRILQDIATRL